MLDELKILRKRCLEIANLGGDANLPSSFSSLEIIWTLYHKIMNWSVEYAMNVDRDYFILSKGNANLALLVVLEDIGFFKKEELNTYCKFGSRFSSQSDRCKFNGGIEVSAGSLGHGLPMAVGMALAGKMKKDESHIYVMVGDGEMNEGTMWEACIFAGARKLNNLTIIIDDNQSIKRMIDLSEFRVKLEAFGFRVFSVCGHDIQSLQKTCIDAVQEDNLPTAIIASTKRGYGSKTLMTDRSWFHRAPNIQELLMLRQEVDEFEKAND